MYFWSRHKKQLLAFLSLFIFVGSVCSSSFVSNAEEMATGMEFYTNYAEPTTSDSQGYITLLLQDDVTADYIIMTWFWSCYAVDNGVQSPAEMLVTLTSDSITFNVTQYGATAVSYTHLTLPTMAVV